MDHAFGVAEVSHKKLAAPEFSIETKPKPVKSNADHFPLDLVVGHAARDVRVMMLHSDLRRDVRERERKLRREILRMQIVSNDFRIDVKQLLVMFDAFGERTQRLEILEIADVMTHKRAVPARE